jgi:hypothetical protein
MKKLLLLLIGFVLLNTQLHSQTVSKYLYDLKNRPSGLTEIEAKYLMDHPGLVDTVFSNWNGRGTFEAPKLGSGKFLFFPNPSQIYEYYLKNVISYKNGWHDYPIKVKASSQDDMPKLICIFYVAYALLILLYFYQENKGFDSTLTITGLIFGGGMALFMLHVMIPHGDPQMGYSIFFWMVTLVLLKPMLHLSIFIFNKIRPVTMKGVKNIRSFLQLEGIAD